MVCPYSLSRPGGVQGQAQGLARALRRRGHAVSLLAPADGRPGTWRSDGEGGGTVWLGHPVGLRANGSVAPVCLWPSAAWRVRSVALARHVDVVHLHEPLAPVAAYGVLARPPAPLVGTFHRSGSSPWYGALRPLAGWAAGHLSVRCAVSEAAGRTASAALGGACEVLFNGVDTERFAPLEPAPDRSAAAPTLVFLGRHEPRKGLAVLLEAFARLTAPATLWVAGDGPATPALRARYGGDRRIEWLGVLPDDEVPGRLARADVLCAPSLGGESFGMVLLEAMAAGCAVVASDIDGYRQAAGGHARLVAPGDAAAWTPALEEAVAGAALASGASSPASLAGARAHAEGWSMDRLAACYEERYQAALAAGGSGGTR